MDKLNKDELFFLCREMDIFSFIELSIACKKVYDLVYNRNDIWNYKLKKEFRISYDSSNSSSNISSSNISQKRNTSSNTNREKYNIARYKKQLHKELIIKTERVFDFLDRYHMITNIFARDFEFDPNDPFFPDEEGYGIVGMIWCKYQKWRPDWHIEYHDDRYPELETALDISNNDYHLNKRNGQHNI